MKVEGLVKEGIYKTFFNALAGRLSSLNLFVFALKSFRDMWE